MQVHLKWNINVSLVCFYRSQSRLRYEGISELLLMQCNCSLFLETITGTLCSSAFCHIILQPLRLCSACP